MEKSPQERHNPLRRAHQRYRRPERVAARSTSDIVHTAKRPYATLADKQLFEELKPKPQPSRQFTKPALPRLTRSFVLRREMVEQNAEEYRRKVRINYGWHIVGVLIGLVVCGAVALIIWGFRDLIPANLNFWEKEQPTTAQPQTLTPPSNSSTLDETAISSADIIGHRMAADEPRSLTIPKLDIQARILRVGVSLDNEPIAPNNIHDVGWFESSGKPGNSGAVLFNGNSHGPTKPGVFAGLGELLPGDILIVERGNGSRLTYIVHKVQEYPANQIDMSSALQSIQPGKQGLNLMTTPIKYNATNSITGKRFVVFSVLQGP